MYDFKKKFNIYNINTRVIMWHNNKRNFWYIWYTTTQCSEIRKKVQFQKYKNTFFAISKMAKSQFFALEKSLKLPKMQFSDFFFWCKNWFFAIFEIAKNVFWTFEIALLSNFRAPWPCFRIDFANYTSFSLSLFADARFFDLSSTFNTDKRQTAARFWQLWYTTTPLYSNGKGQKPYDGNIFGRKQGKGGYSGSNGKSKKPATLAPEMTPTVGVFYRTGSQFSVEQSVATKVYEQSSYGRLPSVLPSCVDNNIIDISLDISIIPTIWIFI